MFAHREGLVRSFPEEAWAGIASVYQKEGVVNAFENYLKLFPYFAIPHPDHPNYVEHYERFKRDFAADLYNYYLSQESKQGVYMDSQNDIYNQLQNALASYAIQQNEEKKILIR